MPHFFATHLDSANLPVKSGIFNFIFEAQNLKDGSVIILVEVVDSTTHTQIAESAPALSLRGESEDSPKQSKKNNPCEAPKSRPLRGAKNREQGCSSATADFLLEAEKARALPLKAKKRSFLASRGSGEGGAALFAKETNESNEKNGENIAESNENIADSAFQNNFATQKILLTKLQKIGKILVKFNKHFSVPSKELIKCVLWEYARVTNAKILTHNLGSNSSLGASFALLKFFGRSQTASLVSHPKNFKNTKLPPQNTRIVLNTNNSKDLSLRVSEASVAIHNFCDSKNDKNNLCEAPESRPLRGAKNREQGCSSATADFLLEAEKRGTPPKSEKAAAFWEHNLNEVGGSGSGVQPFLRKEISESNAENSENIADSANQTKITESNTILQNLNAESTHPLTPSAREGEQNADSAFLLSWREICALLSQGKEQSKSAMLEIGFGSGRNILNLARTNPHSAIIGLEIYRPAIAQVLRQIQLLGLQNLFVANLDARVLCEIIPRKSLDRIFLHFPVPWDKNPQRRVLSAQFLQNALGALKNGGFFELLTDSAEYFDFAKDLAKDYHFEAQENAGNAVVSKYEARWRRQGKVIYKLKIFSDGNSSLGNHSADLANRLKAHRTQSPLSLCRFTKNYESTTAIRRICERSEATNTRIVLNVESSAKNTKNAESKNSPSLAEGVGGWLDSANAESDKKNSENLSESASISSLRDSANAESWQSKSICHTERSEVSHFRFCDSAILSPNFILKSLSFSQKGCTPRPAPPTRQKLPLFAFRGRALALSASSKKSAGGTTAPFESDFLHHEAGEIKGASHGLDLIVDGCFTAFANSANCHDLPLANLAMTEKTQNLDSANRAKITESCTKIAEFNAISQNLIAESNAKITHPLTPSAREGEFLCESTRILEGEQNADSANETKIAESTSLRYCEARSAEAIQKNNNIDCHDSATQNLAMTDNSADSANAESNNNLCEAPKTRPLRGAKNREQGCSSATADFLLEADKRGTPPKSEKAAAFWRVGGAGRGVQPFLREKTSEFNPKNGVDSANQAKIAESTLKTQNLNRDSSLTLFAQNDRTMDCHDLTSSNLAMTDNSADSANHTSNCHTERSEVSQKNKRDSSLISFAQNDKTIDCHDSATQNLAMTGKTQKIAHSANQSTITHPHKIHALLGKKFRTEEYFLHIKSAYKIDRQSGGMVLFVVFGAYYAPSNAYFLISENHIEALSDIIPTRANIEAINLLMEHLGD
ncbi:tRNA (guanosine(46)-N7)-methyltransferase TrmB [Helicobacter sp. 23-1045]